MKKWVTEIQAIDPITKTLKNWMGPYITAETFGKAVIHCQENGLGYCKVTGQLVSEIPCNPGTFEPDFSKRIDFDNLN